MESIFPANPESLEGKRSEIREMLNMAVVQQRNLRFNESRLLQSKNLAIELISDLKNEYKIE